MYEVILNNEKDDEIEKMVLAKFKYLDGAKQYCIALYQEYPYNCSDRWVNIEKNKKEDD